MKLFVDDIRRPWDGWIVARNVTEAIRYLASQTFELVTLDHDIACRSSNGNEHSSDETFEAVARYIALMENRPTVWIHTGNPAGGQRMADILGIKYQPINYTFAGPYGSLEL
jgi:hypothetical protein